MKKYLELVLPSGFECIVSDNIMNILLNKRTAYIKNDLLVRKLFENREKMIFE